MKVEGNSNFKFWKKLKWNGMEWKEIATPLPTNIKSHLDFLGTFWGLPAELTLKGHTLLVIF